MSPQNDTRRQYVNFSFYRVMPEWRRLPLEEREEHRHEFAEVIRKWEQPDVMKLLTYSLVGTRSDCDFMLWRICYSLECLQDMRADILRTRFAGYLEMPYSFLASTRHSQYAMGEHDRPELRGVLHPGNSRFLFVYPLVRTKSWYALPFEERQRMVHEIIDIGQEYRRGVLNVLYSFGLDDQEFVIAVETDHPEDITERMMRLREADAGPYVMRDTPMLACIRASVDDMLEKIG
jgi:chlorite dismutase